MPPCFSIQVDDYYLIKKQSPHSKYRVRVETAKQKQKKQKLFTSSNVKIGRETKKNKNTKERR